MIQNIISLCETGSCRSNNQDAVFVAKIERAGLFAVADGMGGHYKGELASQTAVSLLAKWWKEIQGCIVSMTFEDVVAALEKKVRDINRDIYQMYYELKQFGGTTLCLLLIHKDTYAVINVGDSRLYQCQGWTCRLMTTDDVWKNLQGSSSEGGLTQALGAQESLAVHVFTGMIKKKTYFFLCSDGIYKYCEEQYLFSKLRCLMWRKGTLVAGEIRKRVYKNGARDNLSMIFVRVDAEKD